MDVISIIKAMLVIVLVVLYFAIAYGMRSLPAVKLILMNVLVIIVFFVLGFVGFMGIDIGLKEAKIIGTVHQSRNLGKEELIYYGTVKNTGKFTINSVYVTAKIIDNISGKKKVSVRGEGASDEGSSTFKCKAATHLRKGESVAFSCTMPYPTSFGLSGISFDISWD